MPIAPRHSEGILCSLDIALQMQNVADSVQASAKKSAAREALVYFEQFEHFQADGTTSNLSNRMQVESGGPRGGPPGWTPGVDPRGGPPG